MRKLIAMGGLCDCLSPKKERGLEPSARTPLLSGGQPSTPPVTAVTSARKQHAAQRKQALTSIDELEPVACSKIALPQLDKTFQDHISMYNCLLDNFIQLRQALADLKEATVEEQADSASLVACMKNIVSLCGDAELKVTRHRYCIQLEYDVKDVSANATVLERATKAVKLYNEANRLCNLILERSSQIKRSVELIVNDEERLRREVLKSNLSNTDAPEAMKICIANVNKLRQIPGAVELIHSHTEKIFSDIKEASKVFFVET